MTPEWMDGFVIGALITAAALVTFDHLIVPWWVFRRTATQAQLLQVVGVALAGIYFILNYAK